MADIAFFPAPCPVCHQMGEACTCAKAPPPPDPMTVEQMQRFIDVAALGVACGLDTPYEWLTNWLHHTPQMYAYTEVNAEESRTLNAFLAFFHQCGSMPGDPIETWDVPNMLRYIDEWYAYERGESEQPPRYVIEESLKEAPDGH